MSALVEEFKRFARLFSEPILLVSARGHLCAANRSAASVLLGGMQFTQDSLLQDQVMQTPESLLQYLRACSRSAEPLPGKLSFRCKDGPAEYRCLGSAFGDRDEHQRPLVVLRFLPQQAAAQRFIALNRQIEALRTEIARRVRAEHAVQEQREWLSVTLKSIGDGVIATDVRGCVSFMNSVAEAHTGWRSEEAIGRPLTEVFVIRNEFTGEPVESPVEKVLREGVVVGLANHTVLIRRDGARLPIDDSGAPIRDSGGRLIGVIMVFHEVSESRRLERELMRKTAELEEADRRKDQFLAVLAHELRNPLAPLRNGLHVMRLKAAPDASLAGALDMMERQLSHLIRLVNDLMDVSRISRGAIKLRRAPVLLSDVLARSVESVRAELEARGHRLQLDLAEGDIVVDGDADRLTQVFWNLLGNSVKYSSDGGSIRLSARTEDRHSVISVRDEGIGIPPEHLEGVFEMFSQVRIHQGRAEGGLGIGLSLVRTIVSMHGGTVVADSEGPGKGSTFTVKLPLLPRSALEAGDVERVPERPQLGLTILIADDNHDSAHSLRLLLEISGHEVHVAENGVEALRMVDELRPQLVFMDLGMPEMDGVQATRLIRERPYGGDIVVVALTGWGQLHDRERTRSAGADRHVVKPISPEELDEVVALAQRRTAERRAEPN